MIEQISHENKIIILTSNYRDEMFLRIRMSENDDPGRGDQSAMQS